MITEKIEQFREKLGKGPVLGPFSKTSDPAFIEVMGYAGFDFVIIDLEHGPNSVETAQNLIRAAQIAHIFPVVRVKEANLSVIGEVLDIGTGGIQVPQIRNAQDAEKVIHHAKFAPKGQRGVCRFVRAADYSSLDRYRYFSEANSCVVIVHLEGEEAIENLEDIMDVPGLDILFIGPYDLSQSLNVPGQVDHPSVIEKMRQITEKCVARGLAVGTFIENLEDARKWNALGIRYLSYSVDVGIFYESCRKIVTGFNNP